jgi:hypothetical protein
MVQDTKQKLSFSITGMVSFLDVGEWKVYLQRKTRNLVNQEFLCTHKSPFATPLGLTAPSLASYNGAAPGVLPAFS